MADIDLAIKYVLVQEDSTLSGRVTTDKGGRTRYGVAEKYHPDLTNTGFFDTMAPSKAIQVAEDIYNKEYCEPLKLSLVNSQIIANALLSFGINQGVKTAVKIVQKVLKVSTDGVIGTETIEKLNNSPVQYFLSELKSLEEQHYLQVINADPSQSQYFMGWMSRIRKNCTYNA